MMVMKMMKPCSRRNRPMHTQLQAAGTQDRAAYCRAGATIISWQSMQLAGKEHTDQNMQEPSADDASFPTGPDGG